MWLQYKYLLGIKKKKKKRGYPTNVEIHVRKDVKLTY
jgi:hypothetical protein